MDVLERANALIGAARSGEEDDTLRPRQDALLAAWDTSAEGRPADIPTFEGQRVVLIGPPPYSRSWYGQRTFGGLRPALSVSRTLEVAAVRAWMTTLASAPRD